MDFFVGVLSICLLFLFIRTSIQNYRLQKRLFMVESAQLVHRVDIDEVKARKLLQRKEKNLTEKMEQTLNLRGNGDI